MKIMTLGIGFRVEKGLKTNLKRLKIIDFFTKNQYFLPLMRLVLRLKIYSDVS